MDPSEDTRRPATAEPFASRGDYDQAVGAATRAAAAYYDGTDLTMVDADYDELVARIAASEGEHPDWRSTVTTEVAAGAAAGGDIAHSIPMLSLDNAFSDEEINAWYARLTKTVGRPVTRLTVEPKLDGLAVAARYENGRLVLVATRGDGRHGEDVTAQARTADGLPEVLAEPLTLEVRGEVYMTDADFEAANENRVAAGGAPFVNPRNAAAGTLRAQTRRYTAPVTFAAYQLVGHPNAEGMPYDEMMDWLAGLGFATAGQRVGGLIVAKDAKEINAAIAKIGAARPTFGFAIDGAVVKAALPADRDEAGSSSRAPRWGVSLKFPADTKVTKILDVEWSVGRTGVVAPRAVLEPVFVAGTTITFATLHNPSILEGLGIRKGMDVIVYRAGEVIPRITGPAPGQNPEDFEPFEIPAACPNCGSDIDKSEKRWRCAKGRQCNALPSLVYATSRDCLDIEGAGETLLAKLIDADLAADLADLYTLTADQIANLDRMGTTSAQNVIDQIERSRAQPLNRVFCALGIRMTGRSMSRRIAKAFGTMDAIRAATVEQLAEVDGVGPTRAETIAAELVEIAPLIDRLVELGVNMIEPSTALETEDGVELPFAGKGVCVSGSVPGLSRNEANEWVERLGGKSSGSVSKKTSLLVHGDGAGSKLAKAESLGVATMTADEFAALVAAHS